MSNSTALSANRSGRAIQILAVLGASAHAIQSALSKDDQFSLELHDAAKCSALPLHKGRRPDLVILEPPSADQTPLVRWLQELGSKGSDMPVLVVGELLSAGVVQALLTLQATNVLPLPFTQKSLMTQINTVMQCNTKTPSSMPSGAKCWSFMSAVGGAGATTLAVETAFQLQATKAPKKRVALIDLNFIDGACAAYLDVPPNLRLGDVVADPGRIDEALIDAFASPHACGFDVLAATRNPLGYQEINAHVTARLLEVCCGIYDHVVIDISRWMQDWTLDVVAGSDATIIVSELTVPALHAARDLTLNIETEMPQGANNVHLVLNRMSKRVFGHSISMADAQKALGRNAAGSISSDWDGAAEAINFGLPIGQARPKSRISKDICALIQKLEAKTMQSDAPANAKRAS